MRVGTTVTVGDQPQFNYNFVIGKRKGTGSKSITYVKYFLSSEYQPEEL